MTTSEERQKVLQMIAAGQITPEQGAELLQALGGNFPPGQAESTPGEQAQSEPAPPTPEYEVIDPPPPAPETPPIDLPNTQHWWQVPLWIGVALLIAGAFTLAGALQTGGGACLILLCGLPLMASGLLAVIFAWFARNGPWVHIRVKNRRPGEHNVNISVPLNMSVAAVRIATPFVPQMRETGVDEVLTSLQGNVTKDQPMVIDVNDDEDGEHVQVIVG